MSTTRRSSSTTQKARKSKHSAARNVRSNGAQRLRSSLPKGWVKNLNIVVTETLRSNGSNPYRAALALGVSPQSVYSKNMGLVRAMAVLGTIGRTLEFRVVRSK